MLLAIAMLIAYLPFFAWMAYEIYTLDNRNDAELRRSLGRPEKK